MSAQSKLNRLPGGRGTPLRVWLLLSLVLLLASACSGGEQRVWLDAPGWRRGAAVGQMLIPDPATLALDDEGTLYTLLIAESEGLSRPQIVAINRQAQRLWERSLDVDLQRPDQPRVVWDGSLLRLFWIESQRLYTAAMDKGGEQVGAIRPLSGEAVVGSYDVAMNGDSVTVWFAGPRRTPGLYMVDANADAGEPLLIDEQGIGPQIAYDEQDELHAVWAQYPSGASEASFYYAGPGAAAADASQAAPGRAVLSTPVAVTSSLEGPALGIEEDRAYLFWSILVRTGLGAGTAITEYVTFPLGQPQSATGVQRLYVPSAYDLAYGDAPPDAALQAGQRAALDAGGRTTPLGLEANALVTDELVVAAQATVAFQFRSEASQATLVYLDEGEAGGYQLLSFTRTATSSPYVRSDAQGYLYATWLEPADPRGYRVYFGSTAPDIRSALDELGMADVQQMTVESIFGMLAGAVLAPFAAILWLIAPLIVLGVTSFIRRDDEPTLTLGTGISLALALLTFVAVKALTLPGFNEYVPFSAWIPILPEWLEAMLRWGVPLLITVSGLLLAWRLTYRRDNGSVLYFLLVYAATDSVLSMALYGSVVYGSI